MSQKAGGSLLVANSDHLPQLVILQRYKGLFHLDKGSSVWCTDGQQDITSYSFKHLWFQQEQIEGKDLSYKLGFIGMS